MKSCLDCRKPIRKGYRCFSCGRLWELERQQRFPQRAAYKDAGYMAMRDAMLRGGPLCWICEKPGADTIDHVIPLSKGGGNDPGNLRPAHRACNTRKADHE